MLTRRSFVATTSAAALSAADYQGPARRFEVIGAVAGVTVVDDYAHHPTKIRATIAGARQQFGSQVQLVMVHVPHTYSRTLALLPEYGQAFQGLDLLVLGPIEPARERHLAGTVSSAEVAALVQGPEIVLVDSAEAAIHDEIEALVRAAGGRTLALFTSRRVMAHAAEVLAVRLPWPVLVQGELPKAALLEALSSQSAACLIATMSFWQGVDVPGPALSLVIIDRIPFPRPDDPLMAARREAAGRAGFQVVDLPRAATLLAQGAGRLIRTATDRGVVAVLDPRLATASYGPSLVKALPPMRRTRDRAEVEAFLRAIHAEATSAVPVS